MADDVLFNIAESILKNLGSRALHEIAAAWGFKARLERLQDTIKIIKDVLLDAEEKQLQSRAVRQWLERLKGVVYAADDLFDEFATVASQKKAMHGNKVTKEVKVFFSGSNQIKVASSMSHKIKKIREKLDEIDQDGKQFAFAIRPYEEQRVVHREGHETYSYVDIEEVVGRDHDKKAILDILDQYQDQRVCVVPIVGIGGMGKTTLAQVVYKEIEDNFDLRLWVCLGGNFHVKDIVKKILMSATNKESENLQLDQLQKQLQSQINGKKYLLVMDDVWDYDVEKWHKLSALLKVGKEGSKILVTTRLMEVAEILATIPESYILKGLLEEESFALFSKIAFVPGLEDKDLELVSLGKEIVRKCANVPLAIRTLGSLLRGKDKYTWLSLKDRSLAEIPENENHIMAILKVSYHHLKAPLKNCFAYCALFPKDYELQKETLVNLWMAEGFLIPTHRSQSLEDVGEEYFLTLLQRCFFQDIRRDEWGNIRSCKMHDLMHDLALEVVGMECKVATPGEVDFDNRVHHLSFGYRLTSLWEIPSSMLNLKHLRTFLLPEQMKDGSTFSKSMCQQLLSCYRYLRVLDLHNLGVETLPYSIGKLIHLRYLNLSRAPIEVLPDSITKLQNLQTLELSACYKLKRLPADIGKLTNLRSLDVRDCHGLTHMPTGLGLLTSLHSLPFLLVNCRNSQASRCRTSVAKLWELKNLNHLKGSSYIEIHGVLRDPAYEANEANLSCKHGLTEFHIQGDFILYDEVSGIKHDEAVLEGLKPHSNMKKLEIHWYRGERLPSWAVENHLCLNLPNLVEINLLRCGRCQQVPSFSQLPFLKCLSLGYLESVEYMESALCEFPLSQEERLFFPSLQELRLWNLDNLKRWWKEVGEVVGDDHKVSSIGSTRFSDLSGKSFSNLSKLHIEVCPNLKSVPHCPNVEDLALVDVNETLLVLKMAASSAVSTAAIGTSSGCSSKLKTLCVSNVGDLISLPKECLSYLSSVKIQDCNLLNTFGLDEVFRSSNSLNCFEFIQCHNLRSISRGLEYLTALEKLVIWDCKELDLSPSEDIEYGMPWKALGNLQSLRFCKVPKLVALPSGLQYLTNLRSLEISCNEELETLPGWISCFSLLEHVELHFCPRLTSLPEEFCKLTSLNQLEIVQCPGLTKRCQRPTGKDWPKIQHIPFVCVRPSWDD